MLGMAANTPTLDDTQTRALLRKIDKAAAAHEKTRAALVAAVAEARNAGLTLTVVAEHARYSREWVRKETALHNAEREGAIDSNHADESTGD